MKLFIVILLLLSSLHICNTASFGSQDELNQIVEQAWQAVSENHFGATFNEIKWRKLRERLKAKKYASTAQAYAEIRSLLSRLDDPSVRFLTPEQTAAFLPEVTGASHIGVGLAEMLSVDVNERTGEIVVVTPIPHSPAARAGIKPADVLTEIDGVRTKNLSLAEIVSRLRGGQQGSDVKITLSRKGKSINISLRRELIPAINPAVEAELKEINGRRIGYIMLYQITETSGREVRQAVGALTEKSATSFILDLRNNPGGSLVAAREIAGVFLGSKPIALIADRKGKDKLTASGEMLTDKPLAVIVNEGTASAAELVALGLQSNNRAKIVGTKTFGKALIHGLNPLSDKSAIVVTTGHLLSLNGEELLGKGVTPDTLIEMNDSPVLNPANLKPASEVDKQFMRAIENL